MRASNLLSSSFVVLFLASPAFPQQTPTRDPRAVFVLQQSLAAMGGVPNETQATGTVTLTAGSKTDQGTIRILTRGLDQSREETTTTDGMQAEVFSGRRASLTLADGQKEKSLEWAASAQSPGLPSVFIATALANTEAAIEYIGLETLDGSQAHHVRFRNTFASNSELVNLAEFSRKDIWISVASALPLKLAYERREGSGARPRIRMEVRYSDYRNVSGALYPFMIAKSLNGMPWAVISIQSVQVNPGLADAEFKLR